MEHGKHSINLSYIATTIIIILFLPNLMVGISDPREAWFGAESLGAYLTTPP